MTGSKPIRLVNLRLAQLAHLVGPTCRDLSLRDGDDDGTILAFDFYILVFHWPGQGDHFFVPSTRAALNAAIGGVIGLILLFFGGEMKSPIFKIDVHVR